MQNFIYVFSEEARDTLLKMRYPLLKSDDERKIFVFVNEGRGNFSCAGVSCVLSDTLTF